MSLDVWDDIYDAWWEESVYGSITRAGMRLFSLLHTSTFLFYFVVHYEYLFAQGAGRSLGRILDIGAIHRE